MREWLTPGTVLLGILGAVLGGNIAFVLATLVVATTDAEWLELLAWGTPIWVSGYLLPPVVVVGLPFVLITEERLRHRVRPRVMVAVYAAAGGALALPVGQWVFTSWAFGLAVGAATAVSGKVCAELWLRRRLGKEAAESARPSGPGG